MSAAVEPGSPPPSTSSGSGAGSKNAARIPGPVEQSMQTKVHPDLFHSLHALTDVKHSYDGMLSGQIEDCLVGSMIVMT